MGNGAIFISSCPHCGQSVSLPASGPRTTFSCPHCEETFNAPHSGIRRARRDPKSISPLVYVAAGLVSVLLIVGVVLFVERSSATPADDSRFLLSDYPAEQRDLRERAESGELAAQYELARFHDRGTDTLPADPQEAALWYLAAAKGGDPSAQLAIGTLYDMGHGVAKDSRQAERWLTTAAEQGVVEAQKILAVLYLGKGSLPYEPERSIEWMTRAADQGDGEAMFHLSVAYHKGVEVSPDATASERWLQRSVEAGFGPARDILRLRQENQEAQIDDMWRKAAETLPRSSGTYTNPYTQNIPPQYR